jgi:predicted Zn-dependent peptidase
MSFMAIRSDFLENFQKEIEKVTKEDVARRRGKV